MKILRETASMSLRLLWESLTDREMEGGEVRIFGDHCVTMHSEDVEDLAYDV